MNVKLLTHHLFTTYGFLNVYNIDARRGIQNSCTNLTQFLTQILWANERLDHQMLLKRPLAELTFGLLI